MKKLILLALLFLLIAPVYAAKWFEAGTSVEGHLYYLDAESFELTKSGAKFWVKSLYKYKPNYNPSHMSKIGGQRIWYTLSSYEVDCEGYKMAGPFTRVAYGLSSQVLDSIQDPYSAFEPIIPETIGEAWFKFNCAARASRLSKTTTNDTPIVNIDYTRWLNIGSRNEVILLLDSKSIVPQFSPLGYKAWVRFAKGNDVTEPKQVYVNCRDRKLDYKDISPETADETIFNYLCRGKSAAVQSTRPSHCSKYPLSNLNGLVSYPSECAL